MEAWRVVRTCAEATEAGRAARLEDVPELPPEERCLAVAEGFQAAWEAELVAARAADPPRRPNLLRTSVVHFKWFLFSSALLRLAAEAAFLSVPFVIREFVRYLESDDAAHNKGTGYAWAAGLAAMTLAASVAFSWSMHQTGGFFQRLRSALMVLLFDKSTSLAADHAVQLQGRIIGHYANDTAKLKEAIFVISLLTTPPVLLANVAAMVVIAGLPGLVAVGVLLLSMPLQTFVSSRMAGVRDRFSARRDARLQTIGDLLHSIRVCKFMGWEESFEGHVGVQRAAEVLEMRTMLALRSVVICVSHSMPLLLQLSVFGTVYGVTGSLDSDTVFPMIALLNHMRGLMTSFAVSLGRGIDIYVTLQRIQEFLELDPRQSYEAFVPSSDGPALWTRVPVTAGFTTRSSETDRKPLGGDAPRRDDNKQQPPSEKNRDADATPKEDTHEPYADELVAEDEGDDSAGLDDDNDVPPQHGTADEGGTDDKAPSRSGSTAAGVGEQGDAAVADESKSSDDVFTPLLSDLNVSVPRGKLIFVVGATASGKSALVNALLGESDVAPDTPSDAVQRSQDIAFASQDAWIANATLRDNVTLGESYDKERYIAVLLACQLYEDIAMLQAGDATEIGERGINLSGGQKQRVALARCAYSTRDFVIMDDPLSAVDPHVGQSLFFDCICGDATAGGMAGRTRLLVSHHTQFLPHADHVIAMADCAVQFQGSYADYVAWRSETEQQQSPVASSSSPTTGMPSSSSPTSASPLAVAGAFPKKDNTEQDQRDKLEVLLDTTAKAVAGKKIDATLTKEEKADIGGVQSSAVRWIAGRAGAHRVASVLTTFVLWRAATVFADAWLARWTSSSRDTETFGRKFSHEEYMAVFGGVAAFAILLVLLRQATLVNTMTTASGNAHHVLIQRLLGAPMSFFDTTPQGRIMNRFSKDVETLDTAIPEELNFWLSIVFMIAGMFIIMAIAALPIVPIGILAALAFVKISGAYGNALRCLRRLENIARSPAVAIVQQTVSGLRSIRPLGVLAVTAQRHATLTDELIRSADSFRHVQHLAAVVVAFVASIVTLGVNVCAVAVTTEEDLEPIRPEGNLASLAVTYAAMLGTFTLYYVVMTAQLSSQFSAVERVREYACDLEQEHDTYVRPADGVEGSNHNVADNTGDADGVAVAAVAPVVAPDDFSAACAAKSGAADVEFDDVSLRYRPGQPLVLRGVSFTAQAGQRVGLVGRTGSGKSTSMLALFRLVELAGGTIRVGGNDISRVPLQALRGAITIIPQDPTLFVGTVRSNLDPFGAVEDDRLLDALDRVGLTSRLGTEGLATEVAAKGLNFSVGQRQLLCLARALLRHAPVLLLDEATASVDYETDALIQETIRTAFRQATVLVIAHRLSTVLDSDYIVVLRDGQVAEQGTPDGLLAQPTSQLASMVAAQQQQQLPNNNNGGDADGGSSTC